MKSNRLFTTMSWLAGCMLFCGRGYGQEAVQPKTDPKLTPNILANNSSIGNISSPNLYDGSANISIPIYNYTTDAGNFGVSLSYNTKGIKVDEFPSPAGLHWNINAEGSITRALKDLPDECIHHPDPNDTADIPVTGKLYLLQNDVASGDIPFDYMDGESDDFMVSAGTLNFTFNIGKDGFIFTHPHRNVKIEFTLHDTVSNFFDNYFANYLDIPSDSIGFKITDEQGNQFWFKKGTVNSLPIVDGKYINPYYYTYIHYISQWVISKIILADGRQIKYMYQDAPDPSYTIYNGCIGQEYTEGLFWGPSYPYYRVFSIPQEASVQDVSNLIRIDSIVYPGQVAVRFDYLTDLLGIFCASDNNILNAIEIHSGDNQVRYNLKQAFRVSPIPDHPEVPAEVSLDSICEYQGSTVGTKIDHYEWYLRRILKSISMDHGTGTGSEPYYSFMYNSTPLPPRLSGSQDYFGYYNGNTVTENEGQLNIPYHKAIFGPDHYGVSRSENIDYKQAGILTKITNAYGGSVSFEYDTHQLVNVLSGLPTDSLFMGINANDGIRLKSIIESDTFYPGNYKKSSFTYSGGQRFLTGGYFHYPNLADPTTDSVVRYFFNGIYVSPHQFISGSNHGYSQVAVENKDQDGQLLSKRVLTFTNFKDVTSGNLPRYLLVGGNKNYYDWPFTNKQYIRDWEMGLPLTTTDYDKNGKISSFSSNSYTFRLDTTTAIGQFENIHRLKVSGPDLSREFNTIATDHYHPYTGKAFLEMTTTKKYVSDNVSVNDTLWYSYDDHDNVDSVLARNSKGEYILSRNVYNYDVSGPGVPYGNQTGTTLYDMTAAGLEKKVATERWKKAGVATGSTLLDAQITRYAYENGHIFTQGLFSLQSGSPVTFNDYRGFPLLNPYIKILDAYNTTGPVPYLKEVSRVERFDAKGNPIQTKLPDQDSYQSMIWDTVYMQKMADVSHARYNEIAFTSFESNIPGMIYTTGGSEIIVNGNFSYPHEGLTQQGGSVSGQWAYAIDNIGPGSYVSASGLSLGKEYIITLWAKSATPVVSGAGAGNITLTALYTVNGWTFYQGRFTALDLNVLQITKGSSDPLIYIDEVRLFPVGAQMQSWVSEPLLGPTSSTDASGRVTYYEYDAFGRLRLVRDQEGHILSRTTYNVAQ